MFVLPPPPRYPTQAAYNAALAGGHMQPMIETNNILTHPEGDEHQFLVGEGLYVLKEDLHLATPPPHPSEAPVQNPNPLATNPQAATAGTKVSILNLDVGSKGPSFAAGLSLAGLSLSGNKNGTGAGAAHPVIQEHPNESDHSTDAGLSSDGGRGPSTDTPGVFVPPTTAPAFGQGNAMLANPAPSGKDAGKRRKPKNNMTKSNSSFISRVIVHEGLSKRLQERSSDGMFAFANINRSFQWLDMSSDKKNEYLTKVLFTKAHCLCHDVNRITKTNTHIDIIMGFSTGEVIWWEPMSQRYTRLNKNGIINGVPVSEIKWIPGSENLFLAAHMDGSLVVYDKEKEDASFLPEEEEAQAEKENSEGTESEETENGTKTHNSSAPSPSRIKVNKSVHSKNQKFNPVAFWKLSNQRINAFAFSPDNRHLAVVSEDGSLRIIDYHKEELLDLFYSYYGGFICVCWSPDGKYVVTGGQDDLISIWSVAESALVARCQGHHSWVTAVAFDPWRCDDRNYRFGSVGDDRRLCLWDFNVGMLHRPKAAAASIRQRGSIASRLTTQNTSSSLGRLRSNSSLSNGEEGEDDKVHPVEPWSRTATLPPVCSKQVDKDPLSWLEFTEDAIMTSCKSGHIRTWNRPTDGVTSS